MPDRIRILLLEGNQLDAELAERHLICGGVEPAFVRVSCEADFRAELESGKHELILADDHLPDFDGMRALEIARELAPETPFIFLDRGNGGSHPDSSEKSVLMRSSVSVHPRIFSSRSVLDRTAM
jgi:CheY-like chemotaxis protein